MIEGDLGRFEVFEAVGPSEGHFQLVVQALDDAGGDHPFRLEPVQDKCSMATNGARHLLHGLDTRSHHLRAPAVQKLPGPGRRDVFPEQLKLLLEQIRPNSLEVVLEQVGELLVLAIGEILRVLQQGPTAVLQDRLVAVSCHPLGLFRAHLVDGLVQLRDDVVTVENVNRPRRPASDHVQVRLPHVAAEVAEPQSATQPEAAKEALKRLRRSLLAHPEKAAARAVDLVDDREVLVAAMPQHLVDADRLDSPEIAVRKPPGDGQPHSAIHAVPAGSKGLGHLLPRHPLRPVRQEPGVACRDRTLALGPGHLLDLYTAAETIDSAHRVNEEHQDPPERDELKAPRHERVVGRPPLSAAGALGSAAHSRADVDLELDPLCLDEACVGVDKRGVLLDSVQDSLELHPACSSLSDVGVTTTSFQVGTRDALLLNRLRRDPAGKPPFRP